MRKSSAFQEDDSKSKLDIGKRGSGMTEVF